MTTSDEQRQPPGGTVYGPTGGTVYGGAAKPPGPRRDRLLTAAYAVGAVGVLVGLVLASGLLSGGDGGDGEQAARLPGPLPSAGGPPATPAGGTAGSTDPAPPPSPSAPEIPARTFRSLASSFCLALNSGDDPDGAQVRQVVCTAGANQRWRATPVVGDQVSLVNIATGQCLEVADASRDDGARLRPAVCDGSAEQRWRSAALTGGQISLVNLNSGRCVDVPTQSLDRPDSGLQQWGCHGGTNQQWTVQPG